MSCDLQVIRGARKHVARTLSECRRNEVASKSSQEGWTPAKRLEGKVAVVFGAGQSPGEGLGNGRAAAMRYAREGARVLAVNRSIGSAEETASMIKSEGLRVRRVRRGRAARGRSRGCHPGRALSLG